MPSWVPLHAHSVFSIRDSIAKIPDIIQKAKELDMPAVALTDHGTLGGALEFYNEAKQNEIKPLLGCEIYVATRSRFDKVAGVDKYYHLTLIAMNNTGWRNLVKLVSEGYNKDHFYYKPRIDRELLRKYNDGLICLSGCIGGHLAHSILKDIHYDFTDEEGNTTHNVAECGDHSHSEGENAILQESYMEVVQWYKSVFGDRFYLEVQNHEMEVEDKIREVIFSIADKTGIKVVATGDSHFVQAEDEKAHDIMLAVRDKITIYDEQMKQIKYPGTGYNILSYDQMLNRFPGRRDVLDNTLEIAERCNVTFEKGSFRIPHLVDIKQEDEHLKKLVFEGLKERYNGNVPKEAIERAKEELNVIIQMTFPSYFLVVSDYVQWAKNNGILVGPGRGSAAGSIVAYALKITDVNPLDYNLSFSRFLNKGRAPIPQINFKEFPFDEWKKMKLNKEL